MGRCPLCDELVGITDTGEPIDATKSAHWWRVDAHRGFRWPEDGVGPPERVVCDGSGERV